MPTITVTVRGRSFPLQCEVGQEVQLTALADRLDRRVQSLGLSLNQGSDTLVMLMAALVAEDEILTLTRNLATAREDQSASIKQAQETTAQVSGEMARSIRSIAQYILQVAEKTRAQDIST